MPSQTTAPTAFRTTTLALVCMMMFVIIISTHIVDASPSKRGPGDSGTINPDHAEGVPVTRAEWCPGIWAGCGDQCPSNAPHFQTRRDCTLADGSPSVQYWCCYES